MKQLMIKMINDFLSFPYQYERCSCFWKQFRKNSNHRMADGMRRMEEEGSVI